jgi:hypothetical protein
VSKTQQLNQRTPDYRTLSFGAGVQSTALLIAACRDEFPSIEKPDVAIFADTQWEPPAVMRHLSDMKVWAKEHGVEVRTVTAGSIRSPRGASLMPLHIKNQDGSQGFVRRQCTSEYKIQPIVKEVRRLLGYKPHQRWKHHVETWIGISTDEASRMKPSTQHWETIRWPLIEIGFNRQDCKRYVTDVLGREPVKSSCIGCPFHSSRYFAEMRKHRPEEFAQAVAFDRSLREIPKITRDEYLATKARIDDGSATEKDQRVMATHGIALLRGDPYLHQSGLPIEDAYDDTDQLDLFDNECSGYCHT